MNQLQQRFAVPGVTFDEHHGLSRVIIHTPALSGEMFLHGAHVARWQPAGQVPVLWMSEQSYYQADKPIRGGVPICFPWFGPHPSDNTQPAHGLARIRAWELSEVTRADDDSVQVTCVTRIEPFEISYRVEFGAKLKLSLTTRLATGHPHSVSFQDALHTYFHISDIRRVQITGLEKVAYIDKMDEAKVKAATQVPIEFTGETDRVYFQTSDPCTLHDPGLNRQIVVGKSGSQSTIVWNPWIDKAARMPDFGDDEWPGMVCIETANVGSDAIELQPGQSHTTTVQISVVN